MKLIKFMEIVISFKNYKIWRECEFLGDEIDGILTSVNKTIKVTGYKKQI